MTTRLPVHVHKPAVESLDGFGAADHDSRYVFGRLPRALAPFPFSTRQIHATAHTARTDTCWRFRR
jgi:hypothetical protein